MNRTARYELVPARLVSLPTPRARRISTRVIGPRMSDIAWRGCIKIGGRFAELADSAANAIEPLALERPVAPSDSAL